MRSSEETFISRSAARILRHMSDVPFINLNRFALCIQYPLYSGKLNVLRIIAYFMIST